MPPSNQATTTTNPTRPAPTPSLRPLGLTLVLGGHLAAAVLAVTGAPATLALAVLLASGLVLVWGTLWPHSRLFGPVLRRLDTCAPVVWLTFDDGPSADTQALLDLLDRHRARATFFLVAERAQARPGLVQRIVERGHGIGNHTASHPAASFWLLPPALLRAQLEQAQQHLAAAAAGRAPRWFRAVAGHANPFLQPQLARLGLRRVSWTARGLDTVDRDDDRVLARLGGAIAPGAILVLHEGLPDGRSTRLLAALLAQLAERGYATVLPDTGVASTSQLLNGVRPHNGENRADKPSTASSASSPARVG